MPIYLVIYSMQSAHMMYNVKDIHHVIPTTFDNVEKDLEKYRGVLFNPNISVYMQYEFWSRHDESVLFNAAKGE
jgi:hypothetical protein